MTKPDITYRGYTIKCVEALDGETSWHVIYNGTHIQGFSHKVEAKSHVDWSIELAAKLKGSA